MATKFLTYDKTGIARPKSVAERLLQAKEDACHPLAVSACYDLEDGDESLFEEALVTINREFDGILAPA